MTRETEGVLRGVLTALDATEPDPQITEALSAFSVSGETLWGSGIARVIEVPAPWNENLDVVAENLGQVERHADAPSSVPVAFAALPFERTEAARFVIPRMLWRRDVDGSYTVLEITGTGGTPTPAISSKSTPNGERAGRTRMLRTRSVVPPKRWCEGVEVARERIRAGELTKVVLAREIEVTAVRPIDTGRLWTRLRASYPSALCFAIEDFVGASPELLVSRTGTTVRAQPMAGTTPRTGHAPDDRRRADELMSSPKNRNEHQITIDAVHDGLLDWCSFLDAEPTPSVVAAGPVQHLATLVEGQLSHPEPSVLELVAALHPTPAVGGAPTEAAVSLQRELEPAGRGRYAGPVGWVDANGNGTFAVGIRSIEITGTRGRLFTGVGVVADSDPQAELEETNAKARAILSAMEQI